MFNEAETEQFYDAYGMREWDRLDSTAYGKLMFLLQADFLDPYLGPNKKVLDAGCGAGRFSIYAAQKGSLVTLLDLSSGQLAIADKKCNEAGVMDKINGFTHASVTDLSMIEDNTFDTVICYGAVLNYLHEQTQKAIDELVRVTKNDGEILLSVCNRSGVFRALAVRPMFNGTAGMSGFWANPEAYGIFEVLESGNEPAEYPGRKHPARHYFNVQEIKKLLSSCFERVEFGAVPCVLTGAMANAEEYYANEKAWDTIVRLEKALYRSDYVLDAGEFLLARATVKK